MYSSEEFFRQSLEKRRKNNSLRSLVPENSLVDFCSTDYLGFARSAELRETFLSALQNLVPTSSGWVGTGTGSTGSRLMRGNYTFTEAFEQKIASFHKAEAALLFNSGYDTNVGFFSSVPQRGDILLHDELIHVSSRDGMRLSLANKYSFRHNDLNHLEERLKKFTSKNSHSVFVAVESVYSMDGDFAPLKEIAGLCENHGARLVVDEAHSTGVFGRQGEGLVADLGLEKKVFAVVHTFGKGLGCHGGAILGSKILREFLINFSHSFIYSTAIPPVNVIALDCAYDYLFISNNNRQLISQLVNLFKEYIKSECRIELLPSNSPIQCIIIPGNEKVKSVAKKVQEKGFDVRAVLSPSVPQNRERLRICLHSFNTKTEVTGLVDSVKEIMYGYNMS